MSHEPVPSLAPSASGYDQDIASSGQKRRRDGSPSTKSMKFHDATRNAVSRRCNIDICWNCGTRGTGLARVIAHSDPEFENLRADGLFSFDALGDYRNAIPVCPNCHLNFHRTPTIGWVFLPKDLQWFIEFEEADWEKRKHKLEREGQMSVRRYPSEEDYENRCRAIRDIIEPENELCFGGLYNSYILTDMFPPMMMRTLEDQGKRVPFIFPSSPKRWYGSPMASIIRGMVALGTLSHRMPQAEVDLLRRLQDLYSRNLPHVIGVRSTAHNDYLPGTPAILDRRSGSETN